jgi:hypothetical protein
MLVECGAYLLVTLLSVFFTILSVFSDMHQQLRGFSLFMQPL